MACGIPRVKISLFMPLQMQIGKESLIIMSTREALEYLRQKLGIIPSYH